jgi:hypothetical protein
LGFDDALGWLFGAEIFFFNLELFSSLQNTQHLGSIIGLVYISRYFYTSIDNKELRVINLNYWYLAFFLVFAIAVRFYFGTELKIGNAIVSVISPVSL